MPSCPQYAGGDWAENLTTAEADANRALALDAENAEAYAALGYIAFSRRQYVEMVAPAARALALDPDDDTANFWAANQLAGMGRGAEAETILDHILVRDPASARTIYYNGLLRWQAGDAAAATTLARRAIALGFTAGGNTLSFITAKDGTRARRNRLRPWLSGPWRKTLSRRIRNHLRGMCQDGMARCRGSAGDRRSPVEQYRPTLLILLGEPERSFAEFERSSTGFRTPISICSGNPMPGRAKRAKARRSKTSPNASGWSIIGRKTLAGSMFPHTRNGPDAFTCR